MEGSYCVYAGDAPVGEVRVTRQGLYCRFRCRCRLPRGRVSRLTMECGGERKNLGVLVPEGSSFVLETKIPAKYIPGGELRFYIGSGPVVRERILVAVYPDEPFAYLSRLKDAYLVRQEGRCCLQISSSSTTGQ